MILPNQLLALTLALTPSLVAAGMFPKESLVKMLDVKTFKQAMKANQTSIVAFVAPWCGHCQKMVPEYSKAALGLHPLIPAYAVNCHAEKNKPLCAEQGVQGFPTVKLFPRGNSMPPVLHEDGRTASHFYYLATRGIPKAVEKIYRVEHIPGWVSGNKDKHRALLLSKDKNMPMLWKVLGNKYSGTELAFASHRDKKGKSSVAMGLEVGGPKEPKVLLYPAGSDTPIRYSGIHKYDSLSKFFDSVLDGTADLTVALEEAQTEEYVEDPEEAEIARKQEAQRIALMHGGFTDLIDFEKAMLEGGANYHDTAGYGGMMGSIPEHLKKKSDAPPEEATSSSKKPVAKTTKANGITTPMPNTETPAPEVSESVTTGKSRMPATTDPAARPKDEL